MIVDKSSTLSKSNNSIPSSQHFFTSICESMRDNTGGKPKAIPSITAIGKPSDRDADIK